MSSVILYLDVIIFTQLQVVTDVFQLHSVTEQATSHQFLNQDPFYLAVFPHIQYSRRDTEAFLTWLRA